MVSLQDLLDVPDNIAGWKCNTIKHISKSQ